MRFLPTEIAGVTLIEPELLNDERGFFARTWCQREFAEHGLNDQLVQCSLSHNHRRGTLRGMHYQLAPHQEAKLVHCVRGAIYDVILDLRDDSPTRLQWQAFELTAEDHRMLYIPEGLAHGFQALEDITQVFYLMAHWHHPQSAAGIRWDDPAFGIHWPLPVSVISPRDSQYPDYIA